MAMAMSDREREEEVEEEEEEKEVVGRRFVCFQCRLRLSGTPADDVCVQTRANATEEAGNDPDCDGVCRACFGMLADAFVRDAARRAATMVVAQGYAGDEDGGTDHHDGGNDGDDDFDAKERGGKRARTGEEKRMTRSFCVEVKTFEASATMVAQRIVLAEMAEESGGRVEELAGKATDIKPVFKGLVASMVPAAIEEVCAPRQHAPPEFVFDADAPLKLGFALVYAHDAGVMTMVKAEFRAAEKELARARDASTAAEGASDATEKENGNGAHAPAAERRKGAFGSGRPKSRVLLLPQKKRDTLLSQHRPPISILASALEVLPLPRLLKLAGAVAELPVSCEHTRCAVSAQRASVYCYGRYIKRQRGLSQTPWILNDVVMGDGSVEECVVPIIAKTLRAESHSFISSGREDIDVRMLGDGRPFAVELKNPKRFLHLSPDDRERRELEAGCENAEARADEIAALNKRVESLINSVTANPANRGRVLVKDLEFFCSNDTLNKVKNASEGKQKCYRALIWSSSRFTRRDYERVNALRDVKVQQNTPIRVLHRRSPLIREKIIHEMRLEAVTGAGPGAGEDEGDVVGNRSWDSHFAIINMRTSAGTYIKEFVHGDLGRTKPSLGAFLGNVDGNVGAGAEAAKRVSVQILQLDVAEVIV